jgi:tetratricopeptide (TPR) repeat protein
MPAAANLLDRAVTLLSSHDRQRAELQLELAEVFAGLGEFERSEACVTEVVEAARSQDDAMLFTNASLVHLFLRYTLDPQGRTDQVLREAQDAIPILEAAGDHAGLVRAWRLLAWVHGTACQYGAAERAVQAAVDHARLACDRRAETRNQMSLALSALYGPTAVPTAIAIAREISSGVEDDRRAEGVVLCALSHMHGLKGDFVEARLLYRAARATLEELGGKVMAATVSLNSGRVELLAGRPDAAEAELRADYDVLVAIGERYTLSTVAGLLADAVLRQGRLDEALDLATVSEEAAAEDDVESQNLWRRVRARALAAQGRLDDATRLADEAMGLAEATDAPLLKGETLVDMAVVRAASGEISRAIELGAKALALFEAKGDDSDAAATRALLDRLAVDGEPSRNGHGAGVPVE